MWQVTASDLSADALVLAKDNAKLNRVDISFVLADVLKMSPVVLISLCRILLIFLKMIRTKLV